MKILCILLVFLTIGVLESHINYQGHKVITIYPTKQSDLELIILLRDLYDVDLWNEPTLVGAPVMANLNPESIQSTEDRLQQNGISYEIAYDDLESVLETERSLYSMVPLSADDYNFEKFQRFETINLLLEDLEKKYGQIARMDQIGQTVEGNPIYSMRISSNPNLKKPVIIMECGIHAREWVSVAVCVYMVNELITKYGSDPDITQLVDKYEFNIVVETNPDGYIYTWTQDRLWRKNRSHHNSSNSKKCMGVDLNRNFDIGHGSVGATNNPCKEDFGGEFPFSEKESAALRDLIIRTKDSAVAYFALHAFSQFWMSPYSISKEPPPNYNELMRIGQYGVDTLAAKYGTKYTLGSIANVIYQVAGSSVDYAYEKQGVAIAFALELRDTGKHGFLLPENEILPTCEETFAGLKAAIFAFP